MTATVWPKELMEIFKPEAVAPVVGYLAAEECADTGTFYEVFGGYTAQMRWQRTYGAVFPNDKDVTPEEVLSKWKEIVTFDDRATNPSSGVEALQQIVQNFNNTSSVVRGEVSYEDSEDTKDIKAAKRQEVDPHEYNFSERDVILYNLGLGAKADELHWVYENSDGFSVSLASPCRPGYC